MTSVSVASVEETARPSGLLESLRLNHHHAGKSRPVGPIAELFSSTGLRAPLRMATLIPTIAVTVLAAYSAPAELQAPVGSSPSAAVQTGESLVKTDLVALDKALVAGQPFAVGVRFKIAPQWHVYWKNPGDSGGPPGISITAPAGFTVGPVEYPRPSIIEHPGEVNIGYEKEVIYRVAIRPPASLEGVPERISIEAKLDWMVCSDRCLIGRRTVRMELPTRGPVPAELLAAAGEFPKSLAELGLTATSDGATLTITGGKVSKGTVARFIPDITPGVTYGATVPPAGTADDQGLVLVVPLTVNPQNALGKPLRAAGLITLTGTDGVSAGSAELDVGITR